MDFGLTLSERLSFEVAVRLPRFFKAFLFHAFPCCPKDSFVVYLVSDMFSPLLPFRSEIKFCLLFHLWLLKPFPILLFQFFIEWIASFGFGIILSNFQLSLVFQNIARKADKLLVSRFYKRGRAISIVVNCQITNVISLYNRELVIC